FGAFLDSTLDRIEEGVVLTAVAVRFTKAHNEMAVAAVVVGVLASLMVSYTRARAEALGVENKGGIATRPVRVVILSIGLIMSANATCIDGTAAYGLNSALTVTESDGMPVKSETA